MVPLLVLCYLSSERAVDLDFTMPLGTLNSCPLGRLSCDGLFSILGSRVASLMISSRDILSWSETSMPGIPVRQRASSSLSNLGERVSSSCCGKTRLIALKQSNVTRQSRTKQKSEMHLMQYFETLAFWPAALLPPPAPIYSALLTFVCSAKRQFTLNCNMTREHISSV